MDLLGRPVEPAGHIARNAEGLLEITARCQCVVIDIPIGFLAVGQPGGRKADRAARRLLRPRTSTVFSAPPRAVLRARSYDEARQLAVQHSAHGTALTKQAFAILPKLRDMDAVMSPDRQRRVVEGHPELSFRTMNGGAPLNHSKHTGAGIIERIRLLENAGVSEALRHVAASVGRAAKLDDILDAAALAWTARRIVQGTAERVPEDPPTDEKGLRMEMWF